MLSLKSVFETLLTPYWDALKRAGTLEQKYRFMASQGGTTHQKSSYGATAMSDAIMYVDTGYNKNFKSATLHVSNHPSFATIQFPSHFSIR